MSNLDVYLPAVDGSAYWPVSKGDSGKEAIEAIFSDDWAAPPTRLVVKVTTDTGKVVEVSIPYDDTGNTTVRIDGEPV
ncbi:hypothetical protein KV580_22070 [Pseudomonas chlororaphis]|nr:hypothetical protein [Pseudomonas chlororaphis]